MTVVADPSPEEIESFRKLPMGFHTLDIKDQNDTPPFMVWVKASFRHKGATGFQPQGFRLTEEHEEWCEANLRFGWQLIRFRWAMPDTQRKPHRCSCPTCLQMASNKRDLIDPTRYQHRYGLLLGSERDVFIYRMFHYENPSL